MNNAINEKGKLELPVLKQEKKDESNSKYWRSLNFLENANSKEVKKLKKNEFLDGASDDFDLSSMPEPSRRKFLALASAGAAFGAVACTDYRDKGQIVAYNKKPESILPGRPNYYASTYTENGMGWGILVKTREGRPIKINGNPEHPLNKGKINAIAQASILNLYDPTRLKTPAKVANKAYAPAKWEDVDKEIISALNSAKSSGKEIVLLTHTITSPTFSKLIAEFTQKYPTAKVVSYELNSNINYVNAWKACYGNANTPVIELSKAKIILSLESDFLGTEGDTVLNAQDFTSNRDVENVENFNRLYSVESVMSSTGSLADYRFRLTPAMQYDFLLALINEVSKKSGKSLDSASAAKVASANLKEFAAKNGFDSKHLEELVNDLAHNNGKSIAMAGNHLPEEVHIAVNLLNELIGGTELYSKTQSYVNYGALASGSDIANLANSMKAGKVGVLINFDTNPVYHFAKDSGFAEALGSVSTVVTMSEFDNETAKVSNYVLPANHNLESWGDSKVRTGIYSLVQPVISPIYPETRQKEAMLLTWLNDGKYDFDNYHNFLKANSTSSYYPAFDLMVEAETYWNTTLHDGFISFKESASSLGSWNSSAFAASKNTLAIQGFTMVLLPSEFLGDGRYANNGWLQELPNTVTKVTWDNYAMVSPATAKALNINYKEYDKFQVVELTANGSTVKLPVFIQVGMADNVIATELGYGRTVCGEVGLNVGQNTNVFLSAKSAAPNIVADVKVRLTSEEYELAGVQEHNAFDEPGANVKIQNLHKEREIIRELTVAEFVANPKALKEHEHEIISIVDPVKYPGVKWAMAIDLNKCTGCNACTISCNVENNIPVVGKAQVLKGREMSWIRIDRYFSGTPNAPEVSLQPMLCQHCDNAPCENVCPVVATTHSPDGLNQMAYNRCVGTRYCANNCPYKVRRFNYLDFRDAVQDGYYYKESVNLVHNPEVTVRSRGVIEKCTFCIQRTSEARQIATENGLPLKGSDVVTACQEACPTSAIYFGDSNEKEGLIAKLREHNLGYHVLEEINVKPNVTYIAKLRNVKSEGEKREH